MEDLKKKLLSTALGELVSSIIFIYVYTLFDIRKATIIPFIFLIFILLQGSFYWFYTYFLLSKKQKRKNSLIFTLKILNVLNILILIISFLSIFIFKSSAFILIISLFIYMFGLIEYINYYWYRLSYGKSGFNIVLLFKTGLKKSSINRLINGK